MTLNFPEKCRNYLEFFCSEIQERSVGSEGNRMATLFFKKALSDLGWDTVSSRFEAMDWRDNGALLKCENRVYEVLVSPYSCGFNGEAELVPVSDVKELETFEIKGKIVHLHGEIAREQLMPKNFVFYNPDEHQKIISLLEKGEPSAIIAATGRNAALAGGVYPFPLIEDGDFDIPSVYMTEEEGQKLLRDAGKTVFLASKSERIPGKGYNITGRKGNNFKNRVVITAHIDAKKGTPGAIDNATGVVILLLLADLLKDYNGDRLVELVALNGEDYYSVPGQMNYVMANQGRFSEMILNINIDGAGYVEGPSAFSLFSLPEEIYGKTQKVIGQYPGITEGVQWVQGDHSIFLQFGVPAIAVSSKWFTDNISVQDITHTPNDNISIVDCSKLIEISDALNSLVRKL